MRQAVFLQGFKNARLLRNQLDITRAKPKSYIIERTILLGKLPFIYFREHLLESDPNIIAHKDEMFIDENGIWHVLMFCSNCSDIMLLVYSNGKDYANHVSIHANGGEQIDNRFSIKDRYKK